MITLPVWLLLLLALVLVAVGWLLSGWQQLRGAHRALDRLQRRELRRPVINDQRQADQGEADGG